MLKHYVLSKESNLKEKMLTANARYDKKQRKNDNHNINKWDHFRHIFDLQIYDL